MTTARIRIVSVLLSAFALAAAAQSVTTTTVQGTVYTATGAPTSGTLQLSWPAFSTAANQAIAAGRLAVNIGADGFFTVNLAPNQGASPAGLYYTAVYHLADGTTSTEYWTVPAAAQTTVAQVRAQLMPAAQAVQAVNKSYVDQAIQQAASSQISSVGGTLSGPLYLSGDPVSPTQASNKRYVDALFGKALPLAGGAASGPLTATQLGGVYQADQFPGGDFAAKLQACINQLNTTYGGTCDARNFAGSLTMSAPLAIATANSTVLLPCATIATAFPIVIAAGTRNVTLHGCATRGTSSASGSQGGTVFLFSGSAALFQVGDSTYAADTLGFHLDNVSINTTAATSANAQALAAWRTQEMRLDSLYLLGNSNQTGLTLDGTGNYTGGTFSDVEIGGYLTAVNAIGHQTANPATTDWLNASTFLRLHIDCPTSGGNPLAGSTGINLLQGDGNTFTGGDVESCGTALHLGANAQNNTIVGLRNENSTSQVVADPGSSYNNWITGGTMFTGKLTDNGTRNSFLDTFHRSFNALNGDWYGSQQDSTLTNHFRLGIGSGNERGLLNRYQTDYGYRWTTGLSDAAAGEQFYQVLDELNNVYRISVGQYNSGQSSTNNQTVLNSAGTGAVVLNGSNNAGTGGVVIGSGGVTSSTVATIDKSGNANFTGALQVGGTAQSTGTFTVRNNADSEVDYYLWPGLTASQKGAFTYKDYNGNSQWYLVKDASNNWALNSALGGLDSFKAYQSNNSGDTYINASNASGAVRVNYESGSGAAFNIYGGNSGTLYAGFTAVNAIKFPGLAASSGHNCVQIDNSGYITNTGSVCGAGIVGTGAAGQMAWYSASGAAVSGIATVPLSAGGTGASSALAALANLGAVSASGGAMTGPLTGTSAAFSSSVTAQAVSGAVTDKGGQVYNVYAFGAVSDANQDTQCSMTSGSAVLTCTDGPFHASDVGKTISVEGASSANGNQLTTTIAAFISATQVTLAVAATQNTVSGAIDTLTGVGITPNVTGTTGYYSGVYSTTTSGAGTGATLSFTATPGGAIFQGTTNTTVPFEGSGYAVGDKLYPTVGGSDGTAYWVVNNVDGAGVEWGTDNSGAFSRWLAACGGTENCLIPYGKFLVNLSGGALQVPANTKIAMDRQGAIYWVGIASTQNLFVVGGSNVTFEGLHTIGENLVGEHNAQGVLGSASAINVVNGVSHIYVRQSTFQNSFGHGADGFDTKATDVNVTDSYFFHNNNTGININESNSDESRNRFDDDEGIESGGMFMHRDGNTFVANGGLSVGGTTGGGPWSCGSASNNIVINSTRAAALIVTDGCNNGVFNGNTITGFGTIGMEVNTGGYVAANNNSFSANHLCGRAGSTEGIYLSSGTGHTLTGNIADSSCAQTYGLYASNVSGVSSKSNIWAGMSYDVSLGSGASVLADDELVNGKWGTSGSGTYAAGTMLTSPQGIIALGTPYTIGRFPNYSYAPYKILDTFLTGYHGGSSDVKVQYSDGTGANGNVPKFNAAGGLTDSGIAASKALANCGSLTTTAGASDSLTCSWVTTASTCSVNPSNSAAAGLTGVYNSPQAGSVTIYHSATAGATFSVACSVN